MSERIPETDAQLALEPETGTGALRLDLARRVLAEAVGTGFLVLAVIGSGIMAHACRPTASASSCWPTRSRPRARSSV